MTQETSNITFTHHFESQLTKILSQNIKGKVLRKLCSICQMSNYIQIYIYIYSYEQQVTVLIECYHLANL